MLNRCLYRCVSRPDPWTGLWPGTRRYALKASRIHKPNFHNQDAARIQTNPPSETRPSWPRNLFESARNAHALDLSPDASIAFLDDVWRLVVQRKLNRRNVQSVLEEHHLEPENLKSVAMLLTRQRSDIKLASLGLDLLSVSADLGSEAAALVLVDMAIESSSMTSIGALRYQKALSHVKKLANEDKNLSALVVLGKVYEHAQQYKEALSLYEQATEALENDTVSEKDRASLAEAFRNAGRLILITPGTEELAFNHFEIAAREYEDAYSFYSMALMRGEDHPDYITLLSQAAISGVQEATYELGLWYSRNGDNLSSKQSLKHAYSMALQWFVLAKNLPKLTSRAVLHIARIERVQNVGNNPETAFEIVKQALKDNQVQNEARDTLMENWSRQDFLLTAANLEALLDEIKD